MSALNPNHPVTQQASELWYKIAAALMMKFGVDHVELTAADVQALGDNEKAIVFHAHENTIDLKLVSMAEGEKLAREHGGLPN